MVLSSPVGPGSSDTSDVTSPEDGGTPLRTGDLTIESDEEEEDEEYDYGDEGRSLTPNFKSSPGAEVTSDSPQQASAHPAVNGVSPALAVADIELLQPPAGKKANFTVGTSSAQPKTRPPYANVDASAPAHPHTYFSVNSPVTHKDTRQWAVKRQESDLSTAPFSSETSDMDTSGNERVTTADSMVDATGSDVHLAQSPPLARLADGKKGISLSKPQVERKAVGVGLRVRQSWSSGEEATSAGHRNSKKFVALKGIPSKPLPPALAAGKRPSIKSKSSGQSQASQSPSDNPVVPPRKPLPYHQRSTTLLPSKVISKPSPPPSVHSQNGTTKPKGTFKSQSASSNDNHATVSSSSQASGSKPAVKPAIGSRPKPPVNPKPPVAKPAVVPTKPVVKAGISRGIGVEPKSATKPPTKPPASHRLSRNLSESEDGKEVGIKKVNGTRSTVHGAMTNVGKVRSTRRSPSGDSKVGSVSRATGQTTAKTISKKPKDDADTVESKPMEGNPQPVPVHKPSIPSKPKKMSERRTSITKEKPVSSVPSTGASLPVGMTSGPTVVPSSVASTVQSSNIKTQSSSSSSDGTASGHSQSPVASPTTANRRSFHAGKSDKISSSSNAAQKSVSSFSTAQRSAHGSSVIHKAGSNPVSTHKSGSNTISSQKTGSGTMLSHKTGSSTTPPHRSAGTVSTQKNGHNSMSSLKSSAPTLRKNSINGSKSSLSGSGEFKKNDSNQNSDKTKEVKPKSEQRPRITAIIERRNGRRAKTELKKNTNSTGKTKEASKANLIGQGEVGNQSFVAASSSKGVSSCSLDMDSTTQSVSEVSLTESPSPSPSPFPSASDLSADQGKQCDVTGSKEGLRDCWSSEEDTPPPIPPREYLKSPEDLLALNLTEPLITPLSTAETANGMEPKPASAPNLVSVASPKQVKQARRPPPNPPKLPPSTDATPTCNVPTNTAERSGNSFADNPAAKLVDLTANREKSRRNAGSHYEVVDDLAQSPVGNGRYFEKHQQRDSIDPVSYYPVNRVQTQENHSSSGANVTKTTKRISQAPQSPPPRRPVLKRATTVGGVNTASIHIRMETESEESKMGGKINFKDRKMSISRRPPPLPPKSVAPSSSSASSSSTSIAPSTADQEDSSDIYSVIDEEDKGLLLHRAVSQPAVSSKQPLNQRVSMILGTNPEEEPPPLPSRPAPPKLKNPISPDAYPRNPANKQPQPPPPPANPASPVPHKGLVLTKDGPPILAQSPKWRDPVYDVIPETVKVVRNTNRRRDYEEIVLPELDDEAPKLWIPPEREKEKIQVQVEEEKQQEEQEKLKQDNRLKSQDQQQKQLQRDQEQLVDDWSSSSGKSSPFLSKRSSTSSNGSGGGVGGANGPLISIILPDKAGSRLASNLSKKNLDIGDLRENWKEDDVPLGVGSPPIMRRKQAMSFSGRQNLKVKGRNASCRRSHSERLNKFKVNATIGPSTAEIVSNLVVNVC